MTSVYPVFFEKTKEGGYSVRVPDLDQYTEGKDLADAIEMARDVIGIHGIYCEDNGKKIPDPFSSKSSAEGNEIMSYVDIDFDEYRRKNDNRMVRKNCTIPLYLEREAEKRNINFSHVLAEALVQKLSLAE